jgi:transcriptional regulator with XRE-family HTH domain
MLPEPEEMPRTFADALKRRRTDKNLSQGHLAGIADIVRETYGAIERANPKTVVAKALVMMTKFANELGVLPDELVREARQGATASGGLVEREVGLLDNGEILLIAFMGRMTARTKPLYYKRVLELVKRHGVRKVLVDRSMVEVDVNFEERLRITTHAADVFEGYNLRVAVVAGATTRDLDQYTAEGARKIGLDVHIFPARQVALGFLRSSVAVAR